MTKEKSQNTKDKSLIVAFFLAWIIPGMGHLYLGKKLKACLFFACISSLFIVGILIGGDILWYELNVLVLLGFIVKLFSGIVAVLFVITKPLYDNTAMYFEIGNALLLMAGALNMLIMTDLYEELTGKKKQAAEKP